MQLEKVLEEEASRVQKAEAVINEVQQIMMKVPQYRQKLVQVCFGSLSNVAIIFCLAKL